MRISTMKSYLIPFLLLSTTWNAYANSQIALQSAQNNMYVRAGVGKDTLLAAISSQIKGWETFELIRLEGNKVALKSVQNGQYIRAGVGRDSLLAAVSPHARGWETFELIHLDGNNIALKSVQNGQYIRAGIGSGALLAAVSPHIKGWETFRLIPVSERSSNNLRNEFETSNAKDGIGIKTFPIINGSEFNPEESGFVLIEYGTYGSDFCSGTLLANDWVLTARHCFSGNLENYKITMGMQSSSVTRIIPHPNMDVGLIRLQTPFSMNGSIWGYRQKIYSGTISDVVNEFVTCFGYGNNQNLSVGPVWTMGTVQDLKEEELIYRLPQGKSAGQSHPSNPVDTIVGMAHLYGNQIHIWYTDGTVSYDLNKPFSTPESPDTGSVVKYSLPDGKKPGDIVGIDVDSLQQVWVWYKDGTISAGNFRQLDKEVYFGNDGGTIKTGALPELMKMDVQFASPKGTAYSLPPTKNPDNIVEMAIANSRVYTWYNDGTVSEGTVTQLDYYSKPINYDLPPNRTPNGIVGMGINKTTRKVLAWFRTEISTSGVRELKFARLQVLPDSGIIEKGLFSLATSNIGQNTASGDSGGSCIYTDESGEQTILSVHSGGDVNSITLEPTPSFGVSPTVFREWVLHQINADNYGSILAKGDFDNDGLDDFVVGQPAGLHLNTIRPGLIRVFLSSQDHSEKLVDQSGLDANENGDRFGASFAVGDFNDDGYDDLAVGAPGERPGNDPQSGYVFIFRGTDNDLVPWYGLSQSGFGANEADDLFGQALAAGDFNNDGYDDLAVGAPGEQLGSGPKSGFIFIFKGSIDKLTPWHGLSQAGFGANETGDLFGATLAAGDFDGDGYEDLAVSAPGEKPGKTIDPTNIFNLDSSGFVFVFKGTQEKLAKWTGLQPYVNVWNEINGLTFGGTQSCGRAGDLFGWSLGVGDFNGDGLHDLAVGAPGFGLPTPAAICGGDIRSGAIFLYPGTSAGPSANWDYLTQGNLESNEQGDWFGASLATGDLDGDGTDDLVIGAPGEAPSNDPESGWIFTFSGAELGGRYWTSLPPAPSIGLFGMGQKSPSSNEAGDWFGGAVVIGDIDANGQMDIIVGAPGKHGRGNIFSFRGEDLP